MFEKVLEKSKKSVEIEAVQWNGENINEIYKFVGDAWTGDIIVHPNNSLYEIVIRTLEGDMTVSPGDFIIKDIQGKFYPCKPDIFEQTYEKIE